MTGPVTYRCSRPVEVKFAVASVVKGNTGASVTLMTSEDAESCGYEFVEGSRYRVYANDGETSSCDGNELLATGVASDDTRTVWVGAGLGVALVVMAGAVNWLARRSRNS